MHLELIELGSGTSFAFGLPPGVGAKKPSPDDHPLQPLMTMIAQKSEPIPTIPREQWGQYITLGTGLKWESPLVPIELFVELPFWLLVEPSGYRIQIGETTLEVAVLQEQVEIVPGHQYRNSHCTATSYEPLTDATIASLKDRETNSPDSVTYRTLRSVVCIKTHALEDALLANSESEHRRRQVSLNYLQSLVYAHVPFVNRLVNAYHMASRDRFVFEVNECDLPFWFVHEKDRWIGVSLIPYFTFDQFPYVRAFDGTRKLLLRASPQQVGAALAHGPVPGYIELLDAWSLFNRGRYGDAIRLLATSVEITLEFAFAQLLVAKGQSTEQIAKRLQNTFNKFEERLGDYLMVAKRRLPGPILSYVPYINGVRFSEELTRNRELRHKVVHEGRRFDRSEHGPMLRAMETTTWLFWWLNGIEERDLSQMPGDPAATSLRGLPVFQWDYTKDGVVLRNPDTRALVPTAEGDEPMPVLAEEQNLYQFLHSIDGPRRDVELCVRMFVEGLGYHCDDAPPPPPERACVHERYVVTTESQGVVPLFVFDLEGLPTIEQLQSVAARLLTRMNSGSTNSKAICVFNCQNGAPWQLREAKFVDDAFLALATQCNITILSTVDMLLTFEALDRYSWARRPIAEGILQPGRALEALPGYVEVGVVNTFYDAHKALSVKLNEGAELRKGDTMLVRLKDRYHEQVVESLMHNKVAVEVVAGPEKAGVETTLARTAIRLGAPVCKKRPEPPGNSNNPQPASAES